VRSSTQRFVVGVGLVLVAVGILFLTRPLQIGRSARTETSGSASDPVQQGSESSQSEQSATAGSSHAPEPSQPAAIVSNQGAGPSVPNSRAITNLPPASTPNVVAPPVPESEITALESDLEHVGMMVRQFRDALGENPIGTNAEIMKAVLGDNLKQAKIGAPEGQNLNGEGELVDRFGHPYFFHQVSKNQMEIRSAGPDGVMWTGDDRQIK